MSVTIQQIVSKLSTLLEIRYIYRSEIGFKGHHKSLFIIILEGNCSSLSQELSSMVGKIFQNETDSLYRLFSYEYALQQLKDENLFFVVGCKWTNLIYQNSGKDVDLFHQFRMEEETFHRIGFSFDKELERIKGFSKGAIFYLENGDLSSSAFMFHQVMELLFRTVELFMMGKERKCHSIKDHQTYIRPFAPDLGNLFDVGSEEERLLLNLLDEAYLTTRYGRNYHINEQQVQIVYKKTDDLYDMVVNLFEDQRKAIAKSSDQQNTFENTRSMADPDPDTAISDAVEKLGRIEGLARDHFATLKSYENRKGYYKVELITEGYLDASFMVLNLLKVCIMALNAEEFPEQSVPDPNYNVQEVLKYAMQLIPIDEMELLDKLRALLPLENGGIVG